MMATKKPKPKEAPSELWFLLAGGRPVQVTADVRCKGGEKEQPFEVTSSRSYAGVVQFFCRVGDLEWRPIEEYLAEQKAKAKGA